MNVISDYMINSFCKNVFIRFFSVVFSNLHISCYWLSRALYHNIIKHVVCIPTLRPLWFFASGLQNTKPKSNGVGHTVWDVSLEKNKRASNNKINLFMNKVIESDKKKLYLVLKKLIRAMKLATTQWASWSEQNTFIYTSHLYIIKNIVNHFLIKFTISFSFQRTWDRGTSICAPFYCTSSMQSSLCLSCVFYFSSLYHLWW